VALVTALSELVINSGLFLVEMTADRQKLKSPLVGGAHVSSVLFRRVPNESALAQNLREKE